MFADEGQVAPSTFALPSPKASFFSENKLVVSGIHIFFLTVVHLSNRSQEECIYKVSADQGVKKNVFPVYIYPYCSTIIAFLKFGGNFSPFPSNFILESSLESLLSAP